MENEHWLVKASKWAWTPIILGAVVCLSVAAIARTESWEAVPAGVGIVGFVWLSAFKAFNK